MKKMKTVMGNMKNKVKAAVAWLMVEANVVKAMIVTQMMFMMPQMVLAGDEEKKEAAGSDPMSLILDILGVVIGLFPAIGIVIAVIGAYKLFMAFRNDQPDAYSGAAKDIIIGLVLILFETFIWPTLKATVAK